MKKIHLILALLLSGAAAIAMSWSPTTASVKFYIKNTGLTVDGSLSGLAATVDFNPADLEASNIAASVKVSTIKTGIGARDEHLLKEEYFNAAKFPKIEMSSTSFTKSSGDSYIGKFNLTIKGKTKMISVPFTFTESNGKGTFKGSFTINRLDFGVGESSFVMGDDVSVKLTLNTTKK